MSFKPFPVPRRLQPVPELGPYEINVGALSARHVGLTLAVRRGRNTVTGPLRYKPAASMTKPLLVCRLGDFDVALHPAAAVLVVPQDHKVVVSIAPVEAPCPRRGSPSDTCLDRGDLGSTPEQ